MPTANNSVTITPEELSQAGNGSLWRMSLETYHELVNAGTFAPGEAVELIHGYVVEKMPKNPLHAKANQWLLIYFSKLIDIDQGWYFAIQDPITLADSEPEPDFAVIRGSPDDHEEHPGPLEVALLIEVSDSSLGFDESIKMQLYAANNIVEYWIVNIAERQIQVYTEPFQTGDRAAYRQQTIYVVGDTIPVILDGREYGRILVSAIMPEG